MHRRGSSAVWRKVRQPVSGRRRSVAGLWWSVELADNFPRFLVSLVLTPRFVLIAAIAIWRALRSPGVEVIGRVWLWVQRSLAQVTLAQLITVDDVLALVASFFLSSKFRGRIAWRRDWDRGCCWSVWRHPGAG